MTVFLSNLVHRNLKKESSNCFSKCDKKKPYDKYDGSLISSMKVFVVCMFPEGYLLYPQDSILSHFPYSLGIILPVSLSMNSTNRLLCPQLGQSTFLA